MRKGFLIDTNVLVYAINKDSQFHIESKNLFEFAMNTNVNAYLSTNNLLEFLAIVTDRKRIENPLSVGQAEAVIEIILNSNINIINPDKSSIIKAIEISKELEIKGQKIFDLILVGMMEVNDISTIVTYNTKDFTKIKEIDVIKPKDILKDR